MSDLAGLKTRITTVSTAITGRSSSITTRGTELKAQEDKVDPLTARIVALEQPPLDPAVTQLEKDSTKAGEDIPTAAEIAAQGTKLTDLGTRVTALEGAK